MGGSLTYLRTWAMILLAVVIIGYALFQTRNIVRGPIIDVYTPRNGASVSESLITITGTAKNISFISLNGQQIFVDENGSFSQKLLLSYGYNIMTLYARDKFGRETENVLELMYQ